MTKTELALHGGQPVRTQPWPSWPQWDETERDGLLAVLQRGEWGGYDTAVTEFESAFAARHAAQFCVTTVNGTTTIETALRALDIGPGDEVIVPPYTFIATAASVRIVGATPVFADVDLETWNLSTPAVEAAVSDRTKAVIPVHFGGLPVDFDSLLPLARKHNLFVIEDAAHAHGSSWNGQPVGALGVAGSFSFQASKNLTAGEGGALLTNDPALAERMWSIANCGRSPDGHGYEHPNLGTNLRLSGWQAAVLSAGLTRLDDQLQRRMNNARRLHVASSTKSTASRPSAGTPAWATTPTTYSSCATTPKVSPDCPARPSSPHCAPKTSPSARSIPTPSTTSPRSSNPSAASRPVPTASNSVSRPSPSAKTSSWPSRTRWTTSSRPSSKSAKTSPPSTDH